MRKIIIHQSDAPIMEILDDSDESIDEYCNHLTQLMKMGNVAILKTSTASAVLRPSKIVGIKVENGTSTPVEIIPQVETPPAEAKAEEKAEDIITDVDN